MREYPVESSPALPAWEPELVAYHNTFRCNAFCHPSLNFPLTISGPNRFFADTSADCRVIIKPVCSCPSRFRATTAIRLSRWIRNWQVGRPSAGNAASGW
jgi:hypothetical protein